MALDRLRSLVIGRLFAAILGIAQRIVQELYGTSYLLNGKTIAGSIPMIGKHTKRSYLASNTLSIKP